MEWTEKLPTKEGHYCIQRLGCWPIKIIKVTKGNWRLAQNPDWLYSSLENKPIEDIACKWFGPIPEP